MHIRTDGGWIRAGLAVLVAGVLGGGVLAAACGTTPPHKVTADGVSGKSEAASAKPLDLAAGQASSADDGPKADPVVGDKVNVGSDGGSVTVSAVEDNVSAGRLFGAGEGRKYVAAEVKGCSGPHEKDLRFEPSYFLVQLDDKTVHDPGPGAKKPELTGGTVPAGRCLSGWVTFTVPDGGLPAAVIYDGSSRLTWTVPLPKGAKPTTTTTLRPGATTTTTAGSGTTTSTRPKTTTTTARATTTTTVRAATTARATTTTTTAKGATTTTGKPAPTSTTTTTPKPTTTTTAAVATAPTAPTG